MSTPDCDDSNSLDLERLHTELPCNTPPSPSFPPCPTHFDKLATEIKEAIFSHAYTTIRLPRQRSVVDATTLSLVCKEWRAIMKEYHPIWASLNIFGSEQHRKMWGESGVARLGDYLNRSGAYPLKICIASDDETLFPRIFDVVAPHSNRWKSFELNIESISDFLYKFNVLKGRLSLLEYFSMSIFDGIFDMHNPNGRRVKRCTAFVTAPLLSRIRLRTKRDEDILLCLQLPWAQITEFTFAETSELRDKQTVRGILASFSPSLTTLAFRYTLHRFEKVPFSNVGNPVLLTGLRELRFVNSVNILGMLVCPSLEKLEIGNADPQELAMFLNNSSCSMKHFRLNFSRHHLEFDAAMQSSSLSTSKSVSLIHPTDLILNLFIFGPRNLFPSLEILYVELQFTKDEDDAQHLSSKMDTLRKIVESRTQTMHRNVRRSSISKNSADARDVETSPRSSLKRLSFIIHLGGEMNYSPETKRLRKFVSLCNSRNVVVDILRKTSAISLS